VFVIVYQITNTSGTNAQSLVLAPRQVNQRSLIMADKDLSELFVDTLKDIYYAEKQIYKSLPKMAKAANSDQLRAAFEKHHDETEGQIGRLEQIFELIGKPARGKKCDAIEGILDEGKEIMDEYADTPALDAGLLAAAQAVEHYEISRYGTLKTWAAKLGHQDAVKLLDETLAEEKKTDDALSKLALSAVNAEAA
jgi:ferritin-like metal-binding protein YciE